MTVASRRSVQVLLLDPPIAIHGVLGAAVVLGAEVEVELREGVFAVQVPARHMRVEHCADFD